MPFLCSVPEVQADTCPSPASSPEHHQCPSSSSRQTAQALASFLIQDAWTECGEGKSDTQKTAARECEHILVESQGRGQEFLGVVKAKPGACTGSHSPPPRQRNQNSVLTCCSCLEGDPVLCPSVHATLWNICGTQTPQRTFQSQV